MNKSYIINNWARPLIGIAIILGGCTAIFIGVGGGFRSPLEAAAQVSMSGDSTPGSAPKSPP